MKFPGCNYCNQFWPSTK